MIRRSFHPLGAVARESTPLVDVGVTGREWLSLRHSPDAMAATTSLDSSGTCDATRNRFLSLASSDFES